MKRIISLVLTMVLFVACLAAPVMAEEVLTQPWIDILDYSTNSYVYAYPNEAVSFSFPYLQRIYGIDAIVTFTDGRVPATSTVTIGSSSYNLSYYLISGYTYRLVASTSKTANSLSFSFNLDKGEYIKFHSVEILTANITSSPINVIFGGFCGSEGIFTDKHFTNSESISQDFYIDNSTSAWQGGYFTGYFHFNENWKAFDFLDVVVSYGYGEFASISAEMDGYIIPVDVSEIYQSTSAPVSRTVTVRLDLRGIDRTSSGYPVLTIRGKAIEGSNVMTLYSALGYVEFDDSSFWTFWFSQIQSWLFSGFSSVTSSLSSLGTSINTLGTNVGNWISAQTSSLLEGFDSVTSGLSSLGSDLDSWISEQTSSLLEGFDSVTSGLSSLGSDLDSWISAQSSSISLAVGSAATRVVNELTSLRNNIGTFFATYTDMITSSISSGVDSIVEAIYGTGSADDFSDKVQEQGSTLEDMAGAMGAVTRPDVSTAIPDISGYLTVTGPVTLAAVFDPFWKNSYILRLLLGSLAVSVAFTVVYGGKK